MVHEKWPSTVQSSLQSHRGFLLGTLSKMIMQRPRLSLPKRKIISSVLGWDTHLILWLHPGPHLKKPILSLNRQWHCSNAIFGWEDSQGLGRVEAFPSLHPHTWGDLKPSLSGILLYSGFLSNPVYFSRDNLKDLSWFIPSISLCFDDAHYVT